MGRKSLKKLMEEVSKRKDISEEEKESLMAKIRKVDEEKDELVAEIEGQEKKKKIPEIVDSGKEKHNEEELQTLRSRVDELQIEVGRIQKENNELKVELNWRRTHKYADDITLDAGTAHPNFSIAGDQKSLKHEAQPEKVLPNPERFDSTVCVLGSEGFSSGKHYWEVDVMSSTDWDLGVARKSIQRKGKLSLSPKEGFWALGLSGRDYWARTDPWTRVMVQKKPKKIGVYLSYQDKQVTFFSVTDRSVLFTFNNCSFSGAVYPFLKNSHKETAMRICSIREDE
ncbi:butyrophilin subfamily 1 member A1 isoform X7 [Chelonia mydas]|uniref:butyrophilin subfamily 1 member A1 isoform X7 n=1 Tax=Chelonia mydas TaxID=8469 RepID=UPI001CA9F383|nr:butyrophilin subfamily 1 member A1 isoform X7 [Chelonia mydas]XP_043390681.1 butyrophilin subfamily 1 member A1 isoform X7 [Chelonia mydas]